MACALLGKLPLQRGKQLHFALPPSQLQLSHYLDPKLTGEWWSEPHASSFAVSDVYYAEVSIIYRLCTNGRRLLTLGKGEIFECDFDAAAYDALAKTLMRTNPLPADDA